MKIDPRFSSLPIDGPSASPSVAKGKSGGDFAAKLADAIESADKQNLTADKKAEAAAHGNASLHDVALALEKADIEMRLLVRGRNKVVEAYQEIMRMPV